MAKAAPVDDAESRTALTHQAWAWRSNGPFRDHAGGCLAESFAPGVVQLLAQLACRADALGVGLDGVARSSRSAPRRAAVFSSGRRGSLAGWKKLGQVSFADARHRGFVFLVRVGRCGRPSRTPSPGHYPGAWSQTLAATMPPGSVTRAISASPATGSFMRRDHELSQRKVEGVVQQRLRRPRLHLHGRATVHAERPTKDPTGRPRSPDRPPTGRRGRLCARPAPHVQGAFRPVLFRPGRRTSERSGSDKITP